ncbi:hypothetical protein BH11PSE10_BH11PSE10_09960 [soil metagenome]
MSAHRCSGGSLSRRQAVAGMAGLGGLLASGFVEAIAQPINRGESMVWPTLKLLDGKQLCADDWNDTAGVLVFWATWCPYCRRHNARIDSLHRTAAGAHLRILGIALDGDDAAVRHYMTLNGYRFPVVVGDAGLRERLTSRRVIPMTCLVDRRGHVLQAIPGEMAEDDVLALASLATETQGPTA